jgi:hypothetical protein
MVERRVRKVVDAAGEARKRTVDADIRVVKRVYAADFSSVKNEMTL